MQIIDRYAYSNALRQVTPTLKAAITLSVILLCLVLNEPLVGLTAVLWMLVLAVGLARIPLRPFGGILLAEGGFLLLATIAVILSFSLQPPAQDDGWRLHLGMLWISTTPESLYRGANLILRALGAAAAMNFLALTTPMIDLIDMLHRLHMPAIIIDLMTLMYRYIFVLLESLERMNRAQNSRLGFAASNMRRMRNAAGIATRLFIESFLRSRHLQRALAARGYDGGDLRVLPATYEHDNRVLLLGLLGIILQLLVWLTF